MKGFQICGPESVTLRDDLPMPKLHMNEVLVKVKYSGFCGSDAELWRVGYAHEYQGDKPYILGHELVGEVVDSVDDGKVLYKKGDMVTGRPFFSCGVCRNCREGLESSCENNQFLPLVDEGNGSFAEYVKLPAKATFPFAKEIEPEVAVLAEPLAVAMYDVHQSGIKPKQSAFISGGGPIGVLIGLYLRHLGANVTFGEINDVRIRFLQDMGFTVINPSQEDGYEQALQANGGKKYDVVFEICAAQSSYEFCLKVCRSGGDYMLVAVTTAMRSFPIRDIVVKQITMHGVNTYETNDFYQAVELINSGALNEDLKKLVTKIYPLSEAKEAFMHSMSKDGTQMRILCDCEQC